MVRARVYLSIRKPKDQLDLVPFHNLFFNLGGDPPLGGIRLPRPRTDIVNMRHDGCGSGAALELPLLLNPAADKFPRTTTETPSNLTPTLYEEERDREG